MVVHSGDILMDESIAVRVGSGGRIVIPKSALEKRGIMEGDIVLVHLRKARVEEEMEEEFEQKKGVD